MGKVLDRVRVLSTKSGDLFVAGCSIKTSQDLCLSRIEMLGSYSDINSEDSINLDMGNKYEILS